MYLSGPNNETTGDDPYNFCANLNIENNTLYRGINYIVTIFRSLGIF